MLCTITLPRAQLAYNEARTRASDKREGISTVYDGEMSCPQSPRLPLCVTARHFFSLFPRPDFPAANSAGFSLARAHKFDEDLFSLTVFPHFSLSSRARVSKNGGRERHRSRGACQTFTPLFLDASSHLYKRVCSSVGPSVRRFIGSSVLSVTRV